MQRTLFPLEPQSASTQWSDKVMTHNTDETQLIADIIKLHNGGNGFEVDATYSKGRIWNNLPSPLHKFDIHPQSSECEEADARSLPLEDRSVGSIMFDPPFLIKSGDGSKIKARFSYYRDYDSLMKFYQDALTEFWRVLIPAGIVAFKCQDFISGGKQHWSHVQIINDATNIGYCLKDLLILTRQNVMWSPNMARQLHARKNHCYYLVFKKDG